MWISMKTADFESTIFEIHGFHQNLKRKTTATDDNPVSSGARLIRAANVRKNHVNFYITFLSSVASCVQDHTWLDGVGFD